MCSTNRLTSQRKSWNDTTSKHLEVTRSEGGLLTALKNAGVDISELSEQEKETEVQVTDSD